MAHAIMPVGASKWIKRRGFGETVQVDAYPDHTGVWECRLLYSVGTVAQSTVTAEAVGQANLRALPNQITAGTRYPVIGRSEFFPWYLLGDPATNQPLGWVFADLVTVQGDVFSVALSTLDMSGATPVSTSSASTPAAGASQTASPSVEADLDTDPCEQRNRCGDGRDRCKVLLIPPRAKAPDTALGSPLKTWLLLFFNRVPQNASAVDLTLLRGGFGVRCRF